jgi:hypothetical protein
MPTDCSGHANHRIQFEQRESCAGIIQVNLACLDRLDQRSRKSVLIHFQPNRQGRGRRNSRSNAAMLRAFNGLMQPQGSAPEILIAKSVIAEDLAASLQ